MVHPLDPLTRDEIATATALIKKHASNEGLSFNTVTLKEPTKSSVEAWKADPSSLPAREAFVIAISSDVSGVLEGVVDLTAKKVVSFNTVENVHPPLVVSDLARVEEILRADKSVIEQCKISGIDEEDMHKVYCDPWAIGYDERWGNSISLQQCFLYYRGDVDDLQYSHPLDFVPVMDVKSGKVISIDIPNVRRPLAKSIPRTNYNPKDIEKYRERVNIKVTQPDGVSFKVDGHTISWQNFKIHVGFNYREGIVLSDISYDDHGEVRPMFHRLSISEMVVPYGCPDFIQYRKHAFDLGEYGGGYMTNSLSVGCDCKGVIQYLDADFVDHAGDPLTIKNAICIHEEDDGVLFKHSDFRNDFKSSIVTRGTKLIISQIFTAANYEYMIYWIFHQDGTIQLEVKLTGILNTYIMAPDEDIKLWGTQVYPGVNAHNHQHLFSFRIHPNIDGGKNSIAMVDAVPADDPVGHPNNLPGNGFYPKKTVFKTVKDSQTNYESEYTRTWDFFNPAKTHPYSGKPSSYKLVSRECPRLLAKPGSIIWKRAPFARYNMQVVPYKDDKVYPAGLYVRQTSGDASTDGLAEWIGDGSANIESTEVVAYHTFGITHFPAPEDFPIMPAEPITLLLRPRNFFKQNPALDVPPSYSMTTSEVESGVKKSANDDGSKEVSCCGNSCGGINGTSNGEANRNGVSTGRP